MQVCRLFVSKADAKQSHVVVYASPSPSENRRKPTMPGQRNAIDVAAENHQPFNHLTAVVRPFEAEGSQDVEFQQSTRTAPAICNTT